MKVNLAMDNRYMKPDTKRNNRMFIVLLFAVNVIINDFLPFMFGFYLATTRNLVYLAFFILSVIFNIEFDYTKRELKLRIRRLF